MFAAAEPEDGPEPDPVLTSNAATRTAPTSYEAKRGAGPLGPAAGVVALGCAAAVGWMAYQATVLDHLTLGLLLTVVALLGLTIALRQRSKSSEVHLENGTLRLRHGDQHHTFYLTSSSTKLEMSGNPGDKNWKVQVLRRGMAPVTIDHRDVDPVAFTEGSAPVATEPVGEKRTPRTPARRPAAEEIRRLCAERDALEARALEAERLAEALAVELAEARAELAADHSRLSLFDDPADEAPAGPAADGSDPAGAPDRPGGDRAGGRHGGAARGTRPWARITRGADDAGTDLPPGLPGLEQPGRAVRDLGESRHGLHRLELQQLPVRPAQAPPPRSR